MNKRLLVSSAIGLLLSAGGTAARSQSTDQNSDDRWDGPGFYAEILHQEPGYSTQLDKLGGPFSSMDACNAFFDSILRELNIVPGVHQNGNDLQTVGCTYRPDNLQYEQSPCFLTTACVQHAGLADDCDELMLMRGLRDRYLDGFDEGRLVIAEYYRIAPDIVSAISAAADRDRVLAAILREVRLAAHSVADRDFEAATVRYALMVAGLQRRYAIG